MKEGECWSMYHKIHELSRNGLGVSQIKERVDLCRDTIYSYIRMTEAEFADFIKKKKNRKNKLQDKKVFVKNVISQYPEIMATQVETKLKETYGPINVHSRTVNNFVNSIRREEHIIKPEKARIYEAVEELPYGKQAQVDFGQKYMIVGETNTKVYFFAISLSRSRYKYIYFQKEPFTSKSAIACFERAFSYYCGFPKEIVFDQDRVFMVSENYGDLLLTDEFNRYVSTRPFSLSPCRGFDPESKGKIENVVKYVKNHFLSCRKVTDIDDLNKQALNWLDITANAKEHQTIKKIPKEEFVVEKEYLMPYNRIDIPETTKEIYTLRKDNLVIYEGNRYRVPAGTYKDKNSKVRLNKESSVLIISNLKNDEIVRHEIPTTRGNLVGDKTRGRDYSATIGEINAELTNIFKNSEIVNSYLKNLKQAKGRYIRDQLGLLKTIIEKYGCIKTAEAIEYCSKHNIISIPDLKTVIERNIGNQDKAAIILAEIISNSEYNCIYADKRGIDTYTEVFDG